MLSTEWAELTPARSMLRGMHCLCMHMRAHMQLNEASAARESIGWSSSRETSASVRTKESIVAMFGSIMPAPCARRACTGEPGAPWPASHCDAYFGWW